MYEHIQYDVSDPVATITLNRPDALNAITGRMQAELKHALAAAEAENLRIADDMAGHAGMAPYIKQGYEIMAASRLHG